MTQPPMEPLDRQQTAAEAGIPTRPRGTGGTARDMLLSMLVILAIVGAFVALVARPNHVDQPAIDLDSAVLGSVSQLGFTPSYPQGLPVGWTPTDSRVQRGTDGVLTWHLSYTTPDDRFAAIHQASGATESWENRQVNDGKPAGTRVIDGRAWTIRSREDRGVTSYVLRESVYTTVVTGTTTAAMLDTLVTSLTAPVAAAPSTPSATPAAS